MTFLGPVPEFLWLSSEKMTIQVTVVEGIITNTPPIARKFRGQPIDNLRNWMRKQGGYCEDRIHIQSTRQ